MILLFMACKSNKSNIVDNNLENRIQEVMGNESTCLANSAGEYIVCYIESDPNGDPWQRQFAVFNKEGLLVLKKQSIYGNVKWHDDNTLVLEKYSRVMEDDTKNNIIKSYIKIDNEKI